MDPFTQEELNAYSLASQVAEECIKALAVRVVSGARIVDLCSYGDAHIESLTQALPLPDTSVERGVATPTTVSVNEAVEYVSPLSSAEKCLIPGDLVKIALAVHVDGYIASLAQTLLVPGPSPATAPRRGKVANVVCATHFAAEAALRALQPGVTAKEVTRVIQLAAAHYDCHPVQGTASTQMQRYVRHAKKAILSIVDKDSAGLLEDETVVTVGDVWSLNILCSTGPGTAPRVVGDGSSMIYQRDVNASHALRLKASRALYSHIDRAFPVFPFALRSVQDPRFRLGLSECVNHGLLTPFVAREERAGDLVAQFSLTVLITPAGPIRLTLSPIPLPWIHSDMEIPEESDLAALLALPVQDLPRS
ncbi:peptidase M24, structural domain-containing protein [Piptocephalis cylindrospora]|uniref:Probable metalloprotease ARX1 n=1 Tax=Piptocephalis cylindrospora TaxID=1907219 RepID=A0A4V1IXW0_9FUNG|nr:peptidase M24, structural domain-containing protein [Piptocephalis cylindrospora]|eukprot:RKP12429.1 peptidase M24, structural domain-containing protein [Piptocephalis cylindrospora]